MRVKKMSPQKASVVDEAQNYFSNINPIASRIYADFEETKSSYECVWKTLSSEEQAQILNECIIKPEVTLKYNLKPNSCSETNFKSDSFAKKRIIDENISYRDEHSAPFTFKSSSQIDLRLFGKDSKNKVFLTPKVEPQKILVPVPPAEPVVPPVAPVVPPRYAATLLDKLLGRGTAPGPQDAAVAEERQALVSPLSPEATEGDSDDFEMPKTGLDFLDNW